MDYDLYVVIGAVIAVFSLPSLLSAYADRRRPWVALFVMLLGGALVGLSLWQNPGVYTVQNFPELLIEVLARYL